MTSSTGKIIIRADGNSTIGLGHVIRSLALVEMLNEELTCEFLITEPSKEITTLISAYCPVYALPVFPSMNVEVDKISDYLTENDVLVLDGYQFTESYQLKVRPIVKKLVAIDDKAEIHFHADVVINHSTPKIRSSYKTENFTRLLLGPDYSLIRKEFRQVAGELPIRIKVDTVFICMGGSDPFNITTKIVEAAGLCDFIHSIIIVTGSAYVFNKELNALLRNLQNKSVTYERNISAGRMVELILASDIAICPASTIALEVCCVKAGLLTGTVVDNQSLILEILVDSGSCVSVQDFNSLSVQDVAEFLGEMNSVEKVNTLISCQGKYIDGCSGGRLLEEFKKLATC